MTGPDEIVIQGDVVDDLLEFIPEKWPEVQYSHTNKHLRMRKKGRKYRVTMLPYQNAQANATGENAMSPIPCLNFPLVQVPLKNSEPKGHTRGNIGPPSFFVWTSLVGKRANTTSAYRRFIVV